MGYKTAVDWLFQNLWEEPKDKMVWYAILDKAKEMEKEQIMEAVSFGDCRGRVTTYLTDEEYYNEIYGK